MDDVLISMTVVDYKEEEEIMGPKWTNTKYVAWVSTGVNRMRMEIWFLTCGTCTQSLVIESHGSWHLCFFLLLGGH